MNIFEQLKEPFAAKDIEWRISRKGVKNGKPWAMVLAYVTNRAIMERLDKVLAPNNWQNSFENIGGAFLCTLQCRIDNEWISKQDGAQESQVEATKGGISGAMKRAAVQWGIGRYLYDLESGFADICDNGKHYVGADNKNNVPAFKWNPPALPPWALPGSTKKGNDLITKSEAINLLNGAMNFKDLASIWKAYAGRFKAELQLQEFSDVELLKDAKKNEFKSNEDR